MTRTTLVWLTGMVVVVALAGCGASGPGGRPVSAQAAPAAAVTIQTFQFQPGELTVTAGTRVTWTNQDAITHTVTSGTPETRDGKFNSPLAGQGTKFAYTFAQPGTYTYFCDRHQSMRGQIRVN
jgi:plastocyanin